VQLKLSLSEQEECLVDQPEPLVTVDNVGMAGMPKQAWYAIAASILVAIVFVFQPRTDPFQDEGITIVEAPSELEGEQLASIAYAPALWGALAVGYINQTNGRVNASDFERWERIGLFDKGVNTDWEKLGASLASLDSDCDDSAKQHDVVRAIESVKFVSGAGLEVPPVEWCKLSSGLLGMAERQTR